MLADRHRYYVPGGGAEAVHEENYRDPNVKELTDKVSMEADSELDAFVAGGISEITARQGDKYTCRVDYPMGHPRNPVSDEGLEEKYRAMASEFMSEKQLRESLAVINDLENLDDVAKLMKTVVFRPESR
ncbi:MAG: MmgE/PrpD family protein [Chloroflexi bacterium]|nr:MmgE/PrpD family protein [Chloroflexota bacterium]